MSPTPKLFQPIRVGDLTLAHRIVLAPLTRFRANAQHVHGDLAVEYYAQRASTPGTLLITESTFVSQAASGEAHAPGIWSDDQVAAWKRVTDAVHAKGSFIYCQLFALGRAADPALLRAENPEFPYVSASDIPLPDKPAPRPLTVDEIREYVQVFKAAAVNAVHRAGFDGVEVHGANGYLIDQFFQDVCNKRTDEYGGSVENRCRFALDIIAAVTEAVGAKRTSVRLSPWSPFQDMGMEDPKPTFGYFVAQLKELYPDFAYVHVVEARIRGDRDCEMQHGEASNDFIRDIWRPRPLISAGGYSPETALKTAEEKGDLIAFGRAFIANPDLPLRIMKNIRLAKGNRATYYLWEEPKGYVDYPFADSGETGLAS